MFLMELPMRSSKTIDRSACQRSAGSKMIPALVAALTVAAALPGCVERGRFAVVARGALPRHFRLSVT